MTQNGQSEEPSPRPAREGIVLPSDGGAPLLPGRQTDHTTPAGGQSWHQPWGPGQVSPGQEQGQGWADAAAPDANAPAPSWGAPSGDPASQYGPPQGSASASYGPPQGADPTYQYGVQRADAAPQWGAPPEPGSGGHLPPPADGAGPLPYQPADARRFPPEGTTTWPQAADAYGAHRATSGYGAPRGTDGYGRPQAPGGPGAPQASGGYGGSPEFAGQPASQAPGGYGSSQARQGRAMPLPPAEGSAPPMPGNLPALQAPGGYGASQAPRAPLGQASASYGAPQPLPGQSGPRLPAERAAQPQPGESGGPGAHAAPLPPEGAGALLPSAGGGMDEGATQYLPPVASVSPVDEGATQYIRPVEAGALPPEAETFSEATRYLDRVRRSGGPGQGPWPAAGAVAGGAGAGGAGAGPMPHSDPDAEATQFIAPVPAQPGGAPFGIRPGAPEDRQPPAEFDNLFRAADSAQATQQLPHIDPPAAPGGRAARREAAHSGSGGDSGRGGRTGSLVPLIAAVGVGLAVLGIGAGALLSGGGGDAGGDENKTAAATEPTADPSASPSADPAKEQAVALDKLLADSNNSRDSVIKAVSNVRMCTNLGQAATDLRNAAKQRNDLVTGLAALSVDKLPNHSRLTAALTSAWKASASADNHYAAWAEQVAGKKGCRKGQARTTNQTQAGNRESGTATIQKAKAAKLWNSIAFTYGLTERQPTQL